MPETVTKYKLFLASPSDLNEDRTSIEEVVKELNMSFGVQNGVVLELIKWETHSAPGVSLIDAQEVINSDINYEFDLFIGLMWMKFGTPTSRANSGTEEEFNCAFSKFIDSPNSLQILFYFKNTPPSNLKDIIPYELEKVNNFKLKLGEEGVLYWHYSNIEELQRFLRIHIPKRILNLMHNQESSLKREEVVVVEIDEDVENDLGLLDFIEISDAKFKTSTNAVYNIAEATNWIGDRMIEKTDEIKSLTNSKFQVSQNQIRRILKLTAQAMNEYASRISVEIPIFYESFEEGIKAVSSIINLSDDFFNNDNKQELIDTKNSINEMIKGIKSGLNGLISFNESVESLPRIDKEINKAKRNISEKLKNLINGLEASSKLAFELISEISDKIYRIENNFC